MGKQVYCILDGEPMVFVQNYRAFCCENGHKITTSIVDVLTHLVREETSRINAGVSRRK